MAMKTSHYILFDSSCSQCTDLAAEIEKASGGALTGESLYARRAKDWLNKARPGWKFEPTLIEVEGKEVRAYTGMAMRARILTFLNPLQLLKIARIVQKAGVPLFGSFDAHMPEGIEDDDEPLGAIPAETESLAETVKSDQPSGFRFTETGPEIGTLTPVELVTTNDGETINFVDAGETNTILLFLSTGCGFCRALAAYLHEFSETAPERLVLVFSTVEPDKLSEFVSEHQLHELPIVISPESRSAFSVTGIPYAFALDGSGIIRGKGIVNNSEHLDSLAETFYISVEAFKQALGYMKDEKIEVS